MLTNKTDTDIKEISSSQLPETNPKVFVVNATGHPYGAAEEYGELHYLTGGFVSFDDIPKLIGTVGAFISNASPEDYILISGPPLLNMLVMQIWFAYHARINLLQWNGTDRYNLIQINDEDF